MTSEKIRKRKFKKNKRVRRNKKRMGNESGKILPSLSKKHASSNWVNFLKSCGSEEKLKKFSSALKQNEVPKKQVTPELTKVLALDCEMVGTVSNENMLARVSIVNYNLQCVYDKYVKPTAEVGDYRTRFSGIRAVNLENAIDYNVVRSEIINIIKDKILVGHSLGCDLKVLNMKHPNVLTRDTSTYPAFRNISDGRPPSLKKLAKHFLNENIQEGEHCSVQDAKTAMKLYKMFNQEWEVFVKTSKPVKSAT